MAVHSIRENEPPPPNITKPFAAIFNNRTDLGVSRLHQAFALRGVFDRCTCVN
jgi:hypothetical protein